jgi:putative transcriptional regulator
MTERDPDHCDDDTENPFLSQEKLAHMQRVSPAKRIRRKLGLTQAEFAEKYGIPLGTLRDWEQHRREPDQAAQSYLRAIEAEPEVVSSALRASTQSKSKLPSTQELKVIPETGCVAIHGMPLGYIAPEPGETPMHAHCRRQRHYIEVSIPSNLRIAGETTFTLADHEVAAREKAALRKFAEDECNTLEDRDRAEKLVRGIEFIEDAFCIPPSVDPNLIKLRA